LVLWAGGLETILAVRSTNSDTRAQPMTLCKCAPLLLFCASTASTAIFAQSVPASAGLQLNKKGYFEAPGINVMAFQDIYPDGHQGGISIIQNGVRVATNGDIRLDPAPGQWQPMPKQDGRVVDTATNTVRPPLTYPYAIVRPFLP
jgi:hypothetical protein